MTGTDSIITAMAERLAQADPSATIYKSAGQEEHERPYYTIRATESICLPAAGGNVDMTLTVRVGCYTALDEAGNGTTADIGAGARTVLSALGCGGLNAGSVYAETEKVKQIFRADGSDTDITYGYMDVPDAEAQEEASTAASVEMRI